MNSAPVLEAVDVVKTYATGDHEVRAVDGVTVTFDRGSFTAIMGASGSGKTTLMHCLAGLDSLTSGKVVLDDVDLRGLSDRALTLTRSSKVGFIFQQFNLLPGLTLHENIRLPLRLAGVHADADHEAHIIDSLGLRDRLEHRPFELSGGQQQRGAIARALINRPAVIFADEPTGALDSKNSLALLEYLKECSRTQQQSIIMVTHDAVAASFADRVLLMSDGRLVDDLASPSMHDLLAAIARTDGQASA